MFNRIRLALTAVAITLLTSCGVIFEKPINEIHEPLEHDGASLHFNEYNVEGDTLPYNPNKPDILTIRFDLGRDYYLAKIKGDIRSDEELVRQFAKETADFAMGKSDQAPDVCQIMESGAESLESATIARMQSGDAYSTMANPDKIQTMNRSVNICREKGGSFSVRVLDHRTLPNRGGIDEVSGTNMKDIDRVLEGGTAGDKASPSYAGFFLN